MICKVVNESHHIDEEWDAMEREMRDEQRKEMRRLA